MNIAVVRGRVLREPTEREVKDGRQVSIDIGVDYEDGPSESVEVVWSNPPAKAVLPRQGNEIFVAGRIRRRFFRTTAGATVSRTELVADAVFTARQKSQIQRRLADVVAAVEG